MKAKDYRLKARECLTGKWNLMALITLIEGFLIGAASSITIAQFIIAGPLLLGFAGCTLSVARYNDVKIENLFDGFSNFVNSLILYLINTLLIFLWSLLLIIPGIIKSYAYSMSFYIMKDNPAIEANEARIKSEQMMYGHKWELFCLHFSFIGWILLSILTFGILFFWVMPYMKVSEALFYEKIKTEPIIVITKNINSPYSATCMKPRSEVLTRIEGDV